MNMTTANLPVSLLQRLILDYTRETKSAIPDGRPDFVDVLSGLDAGKSRGEEAQQAEIHITYALINRAFLASRESRFLQFHAENGIVLPSLDEYFSNTFWDKVTDEAIENVAEGFNEYKDRMFAREKQGLWDEAHYIDIAQQIMHFFECLESSVHLSDDERVVVVSSALSQEFFKNIFELAGQSGDFNVANLQTTTDEVVAFCSSKEVTVEQLLTTFIATQAETPQE